MKLNIKKIFVLMMLIMGMNIQAQTPEKNTNLEKGTVSVYYLGAIKMHAYATKDLMNDYCIVLEKDGKAVIIESPAFWDNFDEFRSYLNKNDIEIEGIFPSYHPLGGTFIENNNLENVKVYLTENVIDYWETGFGSVMKAGIPKMFGDKVDSKLYEATVMLDEGKTIINGIDFIINNTYDGFDIEIPEIKTVYVHILGHDTHSEILSDKHLKSSIVNLKKYIKEGYETFLSSHYKPETWEDAITKVAYLEEMVKIADESKTGEEFVRNMKVAYPDYKDGYLMATTAQLYKDFKMPQRREPTSKDDKNEQVKSEFSLEIKWEITGVSQPESILSIPDHEWLYVSNVNGEENDGFISRLSKDGKIDKLKWVDGIHTPTGMGFYDGNIYVADQNQVHVIDIKTAKIGKTLPSKAKTLNDISISNDGRIFISDLTSASIYTVENDEVVLWVKSDKFPTPNGVLVKGKNLIVGSVGTILSQNLTPDQLGSLFKIDLLDKSIQLIKPSNKMGSIDGIIDFNDGVIVSDPMAGKIFYVTEKEKILVGEFGGVTDFDMDKKEQVIYAPYLFDNKIIAYQLKGMKMEKWTRVTTKDDFLEKVADKYFGDEGGKSVATSDGRISGKFGGKELKGKWDWSGEYFSRTSTLGDMDLGHDDILIEVTNNKMKLTLEKGNGMSVVYEQKKNQTLSQLVIFNVKDEYVEEFRQSSLNSSTKSKQEVGNVEMKLYEDDKNKNEFYVYSRWKDQEAYDIHKEKEYTKELAKLVGKALQSAPKIMKLEESSNAPNHDLKHVNAEDQEETLFFIFKAKDGYRDKILKQFEKHITNTVLEPGNIFFDLYTVEGDANTFVVYENWRNKSDLFDIHLNQPYSKETGGLLNEAVIGDLGSYMNFVNEIK